MNGTSRDGMANNMGSIVGDFNKVAIMEAFLMADYSFEELSA